MIARALVNKTIANASPTMSTGRLKLPAIVSSLIICLSSDNMMAKTIGIY